MEGKSAGPVVVLGGGLAAVSFVTALRSHGHDGEVVVVSEEHEPAYDRPPLSKEFQRDGDTEKIRLDLRGAHDVEWMRGVRADSLDVRARQVRLADGRVVGWGSLVIATGTAARTLASLATAPMPALTLRTLGDARRVRERLVAGARVVIVGGGVIGLELAATGRGLGASVTVVEALPRLMNRCASPTLSSFLADHHRDQGVDLRLGRGVGGIENGRLLLDDGSPLDADMVVVGIGVTANDDLARAAGIACDDGIFVDGHGRTTCPGVWAIGDVTRQRHPVSGRFERIETWSNAQKQSAATARALVDPDAPAYQEVPWYWSDQYALRMQVAGLAYGDDEVVRGDIGQGKFSLVQLQQGRIVGAACVNNAREFMALKRLIAAGAKPQRALLADSAADLAKMRQQ
jgi:3-phenylpropionate/trans-cinnamate dioxygenase ferredoxin reductase subunit